MKHQSASLKNTGSSLLHRRGVAGVSFGLFADIALIGCIGFGAAHIFWTVLSPTAFAKVSNLPSSDRPSALRNAPTVNPQIFGSFDPFNRDLTIEKSDVSDDAPQTNLNLVIRSLIASTDPLYASVRIETPDGTDRRFQEGDTIIDGVTLERILSDRVILLRRGEREVLFVREKRVLDIVGNDGKPIADPTPDTKITNTPITKNTTLSDLNIVSFKELMAKVQLRRIATENSSQPELVVFSSSDPKTLEALGLQVKDSLLTVNGYDLSDESLSDLAGRLRNEKQLNFSIRREGEVLTRVITIGNDGK